MANWRRRNGIVELKEKKGRWRFQNAQHYSTQGFLHNLLTTSSSPWAARSYPLFSLQCPSPMTNARKVKKENANLLPIPGSDNLTRVTENLTLDLIDSRCGGTIPWPVLSSLMLPSTCEGVGCMSVFLFALPSLKEKGSCPFLEWQRPRSDL